jgi:hypothetical protein
MPFIVSCSKTVGCECVIIEKSCELSTIVHRRVQIRTLFITLLIHASLSHIFFEIATSGNVFVSKTGYLHDLLISLKTNEYE